MPSQPKSTAVPSGMGLVVIETHPVQYHAPVYRALQQQFGIPVTAIYGSDFSVAGYQDTEFKTFFAWDTDLVAGYQAVFLERVSEGGAPGVEAITGAGLGRTLHQALGESGHGVILLPGYGGAFYRSALYHLWGRKNPLVFRAETTDHARARSPLKAWARDRILERLYGRCARVLYIGQHSYRHFTRLGCAPEKLVFSPYCVDTAPFACGEDARGRLRVETRRALGISDEDYVLLFSGKLSPRKAPDLMLEAVKLLPENQKRRLWVLFLGEGELRARLEALGEAEPRVRVHFLGFQNQKNLSPYFHASDLLILPSLHSETWGLVVNEALHHGVPCVVSEAVGAAPDLVHDSAGSGATGAVCRTGSRESLAAAIGRMLPRFERAETRAACRQAVDAYRIEDAARGIATAFQSVLAEGKAKGWDAAR
jgi:glycosyltransferase involved in cell wall biosynthesis